MADLVAGRLDGVPDDPAGALSLLRKWDRRWSWRRPDHLLKNGRLPLHLGFYGGVILAAV